MQWIPRIALALLAFGFTGLGLIARQPSGQATTPDTAKAYDLAISSGTGLHLAEAPARTKTQADLLTCDKVLHLGGISIGASCISPD